MLGELGETKGITDCSCGGQSHWAGRAGGGSASRDDGGEDGHRLGHPPDSHRGQPAGREQRLEYPSV